MRRKAAAQQDNHRSIKKSTAAAANAAATVIAPMVGKQVVSGLAAVIPVSHTQIVQLYVPNSRRRQLRNHNSSALDCLHVSAYEQRLAPGFASQNPSHGFCIQLITCLVSHC